MEEFKYLELQEVGIEEIVAFSKFKDSPTITIIDDLNAGLFNYVVTYTDELKLIFFIIKDTNKIAFIGNSNLALKIAQVIQKQAQVIKAFPKYEVSAFNELGEPAEVFIDINLPNVSCDKLVNYKFNDIKYAMKIRGAGNNKVDIQKLKLKRNNYLKNGKL